MGTACQEERRAETADPVKDSDFVFRDEQMWFCLEKHRNVYFPPDYCPKAGISHWQPRIADIAPSPQIDPADVPLRLRNIRINLSHEERERRAERMRNYWRQKRGEV